MSNKSNTLTLIQNCIDDLYTLLSTKNPIFITNIINTYAQLILIEESYIEESYIKEKGDLKNGI